MDGSCGFNGRRMAPSIFIWNDPPPPTPPRRRAPPPVATGRPRSCHALAACWPSVRCDGPDRAVTGVTADSRQVSPGFLFAALPGVQTSGAHFVPAALAAGATAILHDGTLALSQEIPQLHHPHPRLALAHLAAAFQGHPAREMTMLAITGTNGKTSTAAMVEAILARGGSQHGAGQRVGVIGTTGIYHPGERGGAPLYDENPLTTPDPVSLHHHLRTMADHACSAVVMEVSSHALVQQRTAGIPWRVAVFCNLTRDHLDYHGSEEAYFDSKASLFIPQAEGQPPPQTAIIGTDDPWGRRLVPRCRERQIDCVTFGLDGPEQTTDFYARDIRLSWEGAHFCLRMPKGEVEIILPGAGRFNVSNALAAAATCWQLGVGREGIAEGLRRFRPAPGRMETLHAGQPFAVVVDYAHTPDALERLLKSARLLNGQGRIITVLGCGGERDTGKRALMGQRAARWGTHSIITDDNPRSEDPQVIRAAILQGCQQEAGPATEIPDRAAAIAHALQMAAPGDVVLLAGKGHETVQITAEGTHPFDDAAVAREQLARMGFVGG